MKFAKEYHGTQLRKYTNEPYIVHPFAVAGLVAAVTDDEDMFVAALLHDTVEDTDALVGTINKMFGSRVGGFVTWLTNTTKKSDGNRAVRKGINMKRLALAPPEAKTIKLADIIDNTRSILGLDPTFARVYLAEKREVLEVLKEGDSALFGVAFNLAWGKSI